MDRLATHLVMGIDLGTSNSAVSLWLDGKSVLIPNLQGNVLTPSVVGLDDAGQIIVGQAAHERLQSHPNITKASFKRYMGTDATITLGKLVFRAEEVSALLLRQLKDDVEAWLGYVVKDAVITVPAYFNDVQRRAVKTAGQLAGLNVVRLLNEPTAASLAFGLLENKEHKYLTFDLGGGTFDVSIIDMFEGVIEVCASSGDVRLGGDDFREVIYQWMLKKYPKLHKDQFLIRPELLKLAEHLKLALSQAPESHVSMHWNESDFEWKMTEQELATCCQPLLARLQQPI